MSGCGVTEIPSIVSREFHPQGVGDRAPSARACCKSRQIKRHGFWVPGRNLLGLATVAMVLRRLRHPGDDGLAGAGVSVIMRYTLRLLTLDQLVRAAGLICALEIERSEAGERYGTWPFEIGLWVGRRPHRTSWDARGTAARIRRARR